MAKTMTTKQLESAMGSLEKLERKLMEEFSRETDPEKCDELLEQIALVQCSMMGASAKLQAKGR
jgi:hypothetical protein